MTIFSYKEMKDLHQQVQNSYPFQQRGTKAYSQGCTANNSDFYRSLYSLSIFLWSYKQLLFTLYLILLDTFFAFSLYFQCPYIIYSLLSPFLDPWKTNTCISIYFVIQSLSHVQLFCDPPGRQPTSLLCPWDFPGKNTGAGCHLLLQGIFPAQGSNLRFLHLLHWLADSFTIEPPGKLFLKKLS